MTDEPASEDLPPEWPTCPDCEQRRLTVCPFCQTSGSKFPAADHHYLVNAEAFNDTRISEMVTLDPAEKAPPGNPADKQDADSTVHRILLCDICDEPFLPKYYSRCEWCGHEFGDGIEGGPTPEKPITWMSRRELTVLFALLLGGGVAAIYFSYVFAR